MSLSMAAIFVLLDPIHPARNVFAQDDQTVHHQMNHEAMEFMMEGHDVVTGKPFSAHDMTEKNSSTGMAPSNEQAPMHGAIKGADAPSAHDHKAMQAKATQENLFKSVGLTEKLGATIPLHLSFTDEKGATVYLSDIVDRPTLLQLVFYHCPQTCNLMMASLAGTLPSVTFEPGKDYRVITVSFDHEDTPLIASETKANYMNLLPRDFPVDQWHFLTGSLDAIRKLTLATGFRFKRVEQHNFIHPNVLMVLGDDGKIIRYLYGVEYLPFDVSMAITEATRGTPALSIKKILTYCFNYDPKGKKYVFKTFQITGMVLMLVLGAFFFFFLRKGNPK